MDMQRAETMYIEDPNKMERLLQTMKIKILCISDKHKKLTELSRRLVKDQIIAIPLQVWHTANPIKGKTDLPPEEIINFRLGFIFQAYRVQFW